MKNAYLNLRYSHRERVEAFTQGLNQLGYRVVLGMTQMPNDQDLYVSWNRIGQSDLTARRFKTVLVAENAAWGNGFMGGRWVSLARNRHNTKGMFPIGENSRWDDLGVELKPFRTEGETVILPQRGIGSPPTAMPREWAESALKRYGGRIRKHPGQRPPTRLLEHDLEKCGRVITWGSAAAIQALMWGIPVVSEMPDWIGQQNNTEADRLRMFRELAWAQVNYDEIRSGEAFARLL